MRVQKVKILYCCTQFSNVKSGPGRFTNYLQQKEFDRIELSFCTDDFNGKSVSIVPIPKNRSIKKIPFYWLIRSYYFYRIINKRQFEFDHVIFSSPFEAFVPALMRKLNRAWVMINDYNYALPDEKGFKGFSIRKKLTLYYGFFVEKYVLRKTKRIIVNSKFLKEIISQYYKVFHSSIYLLYKGVDLSFFSTADRENDSSKLKLIFVKNNWKLGGLIDLISAAAECRCKEQLKITVVGVPNEDKATIHKIIADNNFTGKYEILGLSDKGAVRKMLTQSDLLVNMAHKEALGVSMMEAMAMGVGVVGRNVGGIPEVLANGQAGFLVDGVEELAQCINKIFDDRRFLDSKIEFGKRHVQKFDIENSLSKFETLFQ